MDTLATRPSWVPQPVLDLANRLGARTDGAAVRLTQHGTMRSGPGARRMKFSAEQTIQLRQPGFEWRASTGPAGCITVIDALQRGSTTSEVRLLGCVRLAGTKLDDAAALLKGQLLRYLAELAWAPDAILQNALLQWSANGNSLHVAVQHRDVRCVLGITLDEDGRIGSVFTPDRPRKEDGGFVERPWLGNFSDYRNHRGRWLPFKGEVGWVLDGGLVNVWQGEITSWETD
jgi:hypothetical protein